MAQTLSQYLPDNVLRSSPLFAELNKLPSPLAVGWSGGVDSTALLLLMHAEGFRLQAWHIDHGWHVNSAAQAEALQQLADKLGIPCISRRLPPPSGRNREAEARQGRYAMWQQLAEELGVHHLCLAHHADDQAETVCMRMLQGAGVQGCSGMAEKRLLNDTLMLYRPLLHMPKLALQAVVTEAGIPIIEDPSNHDISLQRNYIRHRLFPAMQQAGTEPCQLYQRFQQQACRLWQVVEDQLYLIPLQRHEAAVSVNWRDWSRQAAPVRAALLQRMMQTLHGEGRRLGRRHILLAECWLQQGGRNGLDLTASRLTHEGERLYLRIRP